jgi:hypothetical protein
MPSAASRITYVTRKSFAARRGPRNMPSALAVETEFPCLLPEQRRSQVLPWTVQMNDEAFASACSLAWIRPHSMYSVLEYRSSVRSTRRHRHQRWSLHGKQTHLAKATGSLAPSPSRRHQRDASYNCVTSPFGGWVWTLVHSSFRCSNPATSHRPDWALQVTSRL